VHDPDGLNRKWTDVRAGMAFPFSEKFLAGSAGRYLKLREDGVGAFSLPKSLASAGTPGDPIVNGFSFDAGLTLKPTDTLAIGLMGANLTNPGNGLQPTSFGGGVGFATDDLTLEGDFVVDTTTFLRTDATTRVTVRGMLGFEYLLRDHYPLRLGYRYDQGQNTHSASAGVGYIDPQFALEIGLRRTVAGPDRFAPVTALVIDLQYFLEGSGSIRSAGGDVD
jgi:hypothetical protein